MAPFVVLSVSDMVDHLYAPEAAFFGICNSTGFRFSRSQDRGHLLSGTNKIGATYFLAPRNRGWPHSFPLQEKTNKLV